MLKKLFVPKCFESVRNKLLIDYNKRNFNFNFNRIPSKKSNLVFLFDVFIIIMNLDRINSTKTKRKFQHLIDL